MDYAWTGEVKEAFYNHPYHKKVVDYVKQDRSYNWGFFGLQHEPVDIDMYDEEGIAYEERNEPE
jgi:hypothetical protein